MILVSACLLGVLCKYNGKSNFHPELLKQLEGMPLMIFCPEEGGGLPTPRFPSEIIGGDGLDVWEERARVLNCQGEEMTEALLSGALKCLHLCKKNNVILAVMKSNSPSCGVNSVYDGTFSKKLRPGDGVCSALLRANGIEVISENDYVSKGGNL